MPSFTKVQTPKDAKTYTKNYNFTYIIFKIILHLQICRFEISQLFEDHVGPLTAISSFKQSEDVERISWHGNLKYLSQLFLSSSFDATVKLWNTMVIV